MTVARPAAGCQGSRCYTRMFTPSHGRVQPGMPKKSQYKVVILGSGPAGLTAALYPSRAELEPLGVEGGGGVGPTHGPGGPPMLPRDAATCPGFPKGTGGPELTR